MNTRRSFFKSLAMLSGAAVGCPGIFIPKFEPVKWKVSRPCATGFEIIQDPSTGISFIYKPCRFASHYIDLEMIYSIQQGNSD